MQAMDADLASRKVEDFYYLSRSALVKDERNLDKFDRVFAHVFKGIESVEDGIAAEIPEDWLKLLTEKYFTEALANVRRVTKQGSVIFISTSRAATNMLDVKLRAN